LSKARLLGCVAAHDVTRVKVSMASVEREAVEEGMAGDGTARGNTAEGRDAAEGGDEAEEGAAAGAARPPRQMSRMANKDKSAEDDFDRFMVASFPEWIMAFYPFGGILA